VTSKPDFKVMVLLLVFMQLTRDLFAIAKFLYCIVFEQINDDDDDEVQAVTLNETFMQQHSIITLQNDRQTLKEEMSLSVVTRY